MTVGAEALWGLAGEFAEPEALLAAARRLRDDGWTVRAFTPFPVEGLGEAIGEAAPVPARAALAGGLIGGGGALLLQWWVNVVDYPINVGGRPLAAWPAFFLPAFESLVLGAALGAFLAWLWRSGLPRLNHPVFDTPRFQLATDDRYFLVITAQADGFDRAAAAAALRDAGADAVVEVPA